MLVRLDKNAIINSVETPLDTRNTWPKTLAYLGCHGFCRKQGEWLAECLSLFFFFFVCLFCFFFAFDSYDKTSGVFQSGLQGRSAGADLWPFAGPQTVLWQFSQGEINWASVKGQEVFHCHCAENECVMKMMLCFQMRLYVLVSIYPSFFSYSFYCFPHRYYNRPSPVFSKHAFTSENKYWQRPQAKNINSYK